jgi:hypothetical protein
MNKRNRPLNWLIMITIVGVLLILYYQPQCEPCPPGVYCPPCRSKEQYWIGGATIVADVILLIRIILNRKKTMQR